MQGEGSQEKQPEAVMNREGGLEKDRAGQKQRTETSGGRPCHRGGGRTKRDEKAGGPMCAARGRETTRPDKQRDECGRESSNGSQANVASRTSRTGEEARQQSNTQPKEDARERGDRGSCSMKPPSLRGACFS